jgi:predicted metal-dependent phosphoesterase TrpH
MRGQGFHVTTDSNGYWYLDLHSHSTDASDDAGGTVEGYAKWIVARRKRGYRVDGFVLTEHRQFDPDAEYSALTEQYGVTILRGAELETDIGHVLVYGLTPEFVRGFDLKSVSLPHKDVFRAARETGGFAVAAHAGRPRIGLAQHVDESGVTLDGIEVIEQLNGGSNDHENERALHLAERHGLRCVGGSDAHFVSAIGRCLTAFRRPITTVADLVEELATGEYHPVTVEQTLDAASEGSR